MVVKSGSSPFDPAWSFEDYVRNRGDGLQRHAMALTAARDDAHDIVQAVLERL